MNLKNFFNTLLIAILSFTGSAYLTKVVTLPTDMFYLVISLFLIGLAIIIHENILNFLTVKKVYLTRTLTIAILLAFVLYFLHWSFPGFDIQNYVLNPKSFRFVSIQAYEFDFYGTITLISAVTGMIYSLLIWLKE